MKYIDAELLREKIEKVYKSEIAPWLSGVSATSAIYDYVLPLINSLQQEQSEENVPKGFIEGDKIIERKVGMHGEPIEIVLDKYAQRARGIFPGDELTIILRTKRQS